MNALFELGNLSLPVNPEICWRITVALLHTTWQIALLWGLTYLTSRQTSVSVHRRFQLSFACLLIAGFLPFANYFSLSHFAVPDSVSMAAFEFDASGSLTLFRPSELNGREQMQSSSAIPLKSVSATTATNLAATPPTPGYWKVSTTSVLTLAYLLGVSAMLIRLGRTIGEQHQVKSSNLGFVSEGSHPKLFAAAKQAANSLGRTLTTQLSVFEGSGTAFVVGILKPVVLVNVSVLSGLTPQQLQQILVHELAHVYRLDPITQLLQRFVECILFFHPCVWWISREVSQLRELCCDDLAAQSSSSAEFASTLLQCYQLQKDHGVSGGSLALPAIGKQPSQLAKRIGALLDEDGDTPIASANWSVPLIARLALSALFMSTAFMALSSRSTAEPLVSSQEIAAVDNSSFEWNSPQPIDDSTIEPPHLWFNGVRLELQKSVPEDVQVNAMVDLEFCQFAQWHFGDARSNRVALLIEKDGDTVRRVFLDRNRNRKIEGNEKLAGTIHGGKVWIAELATQSGSGDESVSSTRQIAIYPRKNRVRIRTLGFAKGEIDLSGETRSVRRVDIDGDGIPVGNRDQLWIDLNSDGDFDSLSERFNMADHLNVSGQRFIVRSDRLGQALTLTRQTDLGQLKFSLELADESATLEKLEGALRDKNGMLIAVRLTDEPVSVPPGKYCLDHLIVEVTDAEKTSWRMNLSRSSNVGWIEVSKGKTKEVALLTDFSFAGQPVQDADDYSGFQSHVKPSVSTSNGLEINELVRLEVGAKQDLHSDRLVTIRSANSSVSEVEACSGFN